MRAEHGREAVGQRGAAGQVQHVDRASLPRLNHRQRAAARARSGTQDAPVTGGVADEIENPVAQVGDDEIARLAGLCGGAVLADDLDASRVGEHVQPVPAGAFARHPAKLRPAVLVVHRRSECRLEACPRRARQRGRCGRDRATRFHGGAGEDRERGPRRRVRESPEVDPQRPVRAPVGRRLAHRRRGDVTGEGVLQGAQRGRGHPLVRELQSVETPGGGAHGGGLDGEGCCSQAHGRPPFRAQRATASWRAVPAGQFRAYSW